LRQKRLRQERHPWPGAVALLTVALLLLLTPPDASAMRVVTYNILNFPGTTGSDREDDFRTVVAGLDADVIVVQEMLSQTGVNQFLNNVLNYGAPGTWAAAPFVNGYDTDNALFYRVSAVDFVSNQQIDTALRDISKYVLRPDGYSSSDAQFTIYSVHLKAGSTSEDQTKRLAEATILRNDANALPGGTAFMVVGDYNIRASTESAYQKLVGSEYDNDGRSKDPINTPGNWHDNYAFAAVHTQSPRTTSFGGGATGGMDDRFDQILISYALDDGEGLDYVAGSHVAYGNDGQHFNTAINSGTNYAVGSTIADALHEAADHLPVYLDLQLPPVVDAPVALDFGTVVVGSAASAVLSVENVAAVPADDLDYDLSTSSGFGAPGGSFSLLPGATGNHDVTMDTSLRGQASGTLTVASDDVDDPSRAVSLSGTIVDHANPSLNGSAVALVETLDFGTHAEGEFSPQAFSVHNLGHSELQALLDVYEADISGGDGRFSFEGGFSPEEVGGTPAEYSIVFDDSGAEGETLYEAVLTLSTRDETGVTGGTALDDLVIHLSAQTESGTSVPENVVSEFALRVRSGNPFTDGAVLSLSMPQPGHVSVEIYDVSGRLVETLRSETLGAGTHTLSWNGSNDTGSRCASGVYLVRATCNADAAGCKLILLR
jgi:endonuclease/exonuclease/phosphatase family metal-dependent hydrolase